MSEHDISVEELQKDTTQKQKKLMDMRKKIELMQQNIAKRKNTETSSQSKVKNIEPLTISDHIKFDQKTRSPINQGIANQFEYNSTLFKQIGNQSQPFINNGSGVSNFSSVSNINQILNAHTHYNNPNPSNYAIPSHTSSTHEDKNLMESIDNVLSKMKKNNNLPTKALQKIISNDKQTNHSVMKQEQFTISQMMKSQGESSARKKLEEYKNFMDQLGTIPEEKPFLKQNYKYRQPSEQLPSFNEEESNQEVTTFRSHKKQSSGLTPRSEYPSEDSNYPPLPNKKSSAVERQMLKIKSSMQQIKRLQTQSSHEMADISIDFSLSDEQDNKDFVKKQKIDKLMREKQQLEAELLSIDQQLMRLQSQLQ